MGEARITEGPLVPVRWEKREYHSLQGPRYASMSTATNGPLVRVAPGMNEQTEALFAVVERLDAAAVPYMISGSTAMNFYARPRMTRDIDIVVELLAASAGRLVDALSGDFYVDDEIVEEAVAGRSMFNVIHNDSMVKIDFIVRKDEPYRETEFRCRRYRAPARRSTTVAMVAPERPDRARSSSGVPASARRCRAPDVRILLAEGELDDRRIFDSHGARACWGWPSMLETAARVGRARPSGSSEFTGTS